VPPAAADVAGNATDGIDGGASLAFETVTEMSRLLRCRNYYLLKAIDRDSLSVYEAHLLRELTVAMGAGGAPWQINMDLLETQGCWVHVSARQMINLWDPVFHDARAAHGRYCAKVASGALVGCMSKMCGGGDNYLCFEMVVVNREAIIRSKNCSTTPGGRELRQGAMIEKACKCGQVHVLDMSNPANRWEALSSRRVGNVPRLACLGGCDRKELPGDTTHCMSCVRYAIEVSTPPVHLILIPPLTLQKHHRQNPGVPLTHIQCQEECVLTAPEPWGVDLVDGATLVQPDAEMAQGAAPVACPGCHVAVNNRKFYVADAAATAGPEGVDHFRCARCAGGVSY